MSDQAILDVPVTAATDSGPLIATYQQAEGDGTLAIGSFAQFVEPAGVPLVGESGQVVALIDEEKATALKVAGKLITKRHAAVSPLPQFEGGEHTAIGDHILLFFAGDTVGVPAHATPLTVQPGLNLTYGQILSLGGDFYGVPDAPISDGTTPAQRIQLFQNAYATLANNPASVAECQQILAIMQQEITAVNAALRDGKSPAKVYEEMGDTLSGAWNRATGGGTIGSPFLPMGRYLQLATTNWDHFGPYAVLAYQAGHAAALNRALVAYGARQDQSLANFYLAGAYAMNAFADHFLSDLFSAGHIRDPRKEIYATSSIGVTANLCAKGMHDEDSKYGLMVANASGETWRAYGDKHYFETFNLQNKSIVDLAVQLSAVEIYATAMNGELPANYSALAFTPDLAQVLDYQNNPLGNFAPMFVLNGADVWIREDLDDLNTRSWEANWAGPLVAGFLRSPAYDPAPPTGFIAPPTTAPVIGAGGWNSNQPIPPDWVSGAQVRYFVSFANATFESEVGPACPYYTLSNQFQPTLTGIPVGPAGVTARMIYREFQNHRITFCGRISDNVTTTFADTTSSPGARP